MREEFLIQASLTVASCPAGLLHLDAVYSLPTQGEVHVQTPYIEMGSLEAAIAKRKVTLHTLYPIVCLSVLLFVF